MRIVFLGSGEFAEPTLRWLDDSDHEVVRVITQPARSAGRGRKVVRTPVAVVAQDLGLPVVEVEEVNRPEFVGDIRSLDVRLGLAIAFGQKLGNDLLAAMPGGCLNLHASLLPKYRGAAPINWAVINGEERTGVTVFRMVEKMDGGPILTSRWTSIKPEETAGELHDRLAAIGVDAVRAAFELFAGDTIPEGTPQDDSQATRAPKLKKGDGVIHFNRSAKAVVHHICGMSPWPGASTEFVATDGRWEKVAIARARVAETPNKPTIAPGEIDAHRYVAVADGFVEILEIKPSSGRLMPWPDFVNGRHVTVGDRFGHHEE
jgi:methionyl-tRNA formyltransferase